MKFKLTLEKLKKGWVMHLPVTSERKGKALITEIQDRDKTEGHTAKKLAKLKGVLKKIGASSYVVIYRSKMKQAVELGREMFIRQRNEERASS